MSRIAYVNGAYLPQSEAAVSIEDRGFLFADSVYEVLYVTGGRFIDEDRHLDRLERSLREIRIEAPMQRAALRSVLREVLRRNRITRGLLYMQVSRGAARREHAFPLKTPRPTVVVTVRALPPYPADIAAWAVSAITQPDLRWARCDIKSTGLLPNVLAKQAAREAGAYEAILVAPDGTVTEGSSTNVWIVDAGGVLRTRPLSDAILPGCTRGALVALLQGEGIPFEEGSFDAAALRDAREVFVTSATSFVKPVTRLDGRSVGDGEVGAMTRRLFALFSRHVHGNRHPD